MVETNSNAANADPWIIAETIRECSYASGSGRNLVHNTIFTNTREATPFQLIHLHSIDWYIANKNRTLYIPVMIKNDEQLRSPERNVPHLKGSSFGDIVSWCLMASSRMAVMWAGSQCENCCTIRASVMPNELRALNVVVYLIYHLITVYCLQLANYRIV